MDILRRRGGREMTVKGILKISELITFLEAVKADHGECSIAVPREITGRDPAYGEDLRFSLDQISTTLSSVGPEVDW